ncbi:MAG: fibronectin type III domain-containing protein [Acidobacteria bacterium]|nr:fibronectin type III domain-containing protein [Acidobacteriota bacterium]
MEKSFVARSFVGTLVVLVLSAASAHAQADMTVFFPVEPLLENGTNVYAVAIANDPDESAQITVTGSNADLAPPDSIVILGTGANRVVVYRPPFDKSGVTDLTFTLLDPAVIEQATQTGLQVFPVTAVPRTVTNVGSVATAQATFSWSPAAVGAQSDLPSFYLLEVGDAPGLTSFTPFRIPARTASATLTLPRAGYNFRLRPGNRLGPGAVSAEGSVGVVAGPNVPGPPAGLAISLGSGNLATATWTPPGFGAAPLFYVIEVGTAAGLSDVGRFFVPPTFSASGTLPAGTYAVRIRGVSLAGEGPSTPDVFLTFPDGTCAAPSPPVLSAPLRSGSTVLVRWGAPATGRADGYRLLAGSTPGASDLAVLNQGPSSSYFQLAPASGTYYLSVQATSSCGLSTASNTVAYVEPAAAIPGPPRTLAGSATAGSASLSWHPPVTGSGVATYVIEAGFASGAATFVVPLDSDLPGVSFSGVPAGTYFVRVRARNALGTSTASNEITLTVP